MFNSIDEQVRNLFSKSSNSQTNVKLKNVLTANLKKEVEILKNFILDNTESNTVKNSIIVIEEDGSFVITFNENLATYPSYFESIYDDYKGSAYMPILRNEGYKVKNPKWRKFFGKGGYGKAEKFVEKGIKDYIRTRGNILNIEVVKVFETKYNFDNQTLNVSKYY